VESIVIIVLAIVALRRPAASTSEYPYCLKKLFTCAGKSYVRHTRIYRAWIFSYARVYNGRARHVYAVFVQRHNETIDPHTIHYPRFSSDAKLPRRVIILSGTILATIICRVIDVNIKIYKLMRQ